MPAVFFGSISTLADTSELQRSAFNQAFAEHGLDWRWEQAEYRDLLAGNGGADRIAAYAKDRGDTVDAAAVHETKSTIFQAGLATSTPSPRPGVVETIRAAKRAGMSLGFVTTTSPGNVAALFRALGPQVQESDFDLVVTASDVEQGKPDPAAYVYALEKLGETASSVVAIEDNVGGVRAAGAVGIAVVAFPNENTAGHSFGPSTPVVERLELDLLQGYLPA